MKSITSKLITFNIVVAIFVSIVVITSACAPNVFVTKTEKAPASVVEVPFVQAKTGHIILNVSINQGGNKNFMVDSAAMMNMITSQALGELGLREEHLKKVPIIGWGGRMEIVRHIEFESVVFVPVTFRGLIVSIKEMPAVAEKVGMVVHGILGRPFFLLHDVEIDYPSKVIRLHPKGTFASKERHRGSMMHSFSFSGYKGLPLVKLMSSDGSALSMLVDSGCGKTVLNHKAAELFHADWENKEVLSLRIAKGIDGKPMQCRTYRFDSFKVGSLFNKSVPLEVCELKLMKVIEILAGGPEALVIVLGNDLLADRVLLFDANGEKVYISDPVNK